MVQMPALSVQSVLSKWNLRIYLARLWLVSHPNASDNVCIMDVLSQCMHMYVYVESELETQSRPCFLSSDRLLRMPERRESASTFQIRCKYELHLFLEGEYKDFAELETQKRHSLAIPFIWSESHNYDGLMVANIVFSFFFEEGEYLFLKGLHDFPQMTCNIFY